jgi:hypothetical protein
MMHLLSSSLKVSSSTSGKVGVRTKEIVFGGGTFIALRISNQNHQLKVTESIN